LEKNTILYVDDNRTNLKLFEDSFSSDYNIITIEEGEGALKLLTENEIHLVLADLMMPGMNGIELLEKVMEINPLIPRILLTAYGDLNSAKEAVNRSKIFYFMQKPWDRKELALIMSHAIKSFKQEVSNRKLTEELREKTNQLSKELNLNNKILRKLKVSDKMIKANEQYLQNLINSAGTVIIVLSKDKTVREWNLEAEKYFKLTREQAIGNKIADIITSPEFKNYITQALDDYSRKIIKTSQEVNITGRDGIQYSFLWNISPLFFEASKSIAFIFTGQNIDTIKKAELDLKASEERYRLLAENVSDVIWLLDISGKMIYISPSIKKLRGYTQEEIMKQNIFESLTSQSREFVEKTFYNIKNKIESGVFDEEDETFEMEQTCKDGSTVWTEIVVNKLYDENNKFKYFLGVSRNIEERITTEKELKFSQEKFSAIFNSSPESIILTEFNTGKIVNANDHFIRSMGKSKEEIISYTTLEIGFWTDENQRNEFTKKIIEQGEIANYEIKFNTVDNDSRFGLLSAKTVSIYEKVYILGIIVDITERKKLEKELKKNEEQFRTIYENSVVGYYRADMQGNIILANPTFIQTLGYKSLYEMQLRDVTLNSLCITHNRKEYLEEIETKGKIVDFEAKWRRMDNNEIHVLENAIAIYDNKKKVKFIDGTIIDITAKKDAEEQLLRREQLFKAITEQTIEGIVLLDMDGKIILSNNAFVQLSKYSLFELMLMKFVTLIYEDANPPLLDLIKSKKVGKREIQIRDKENNKFYVEIKGNIIHIGEVEHILVIINNIHEKYLSEKALRRSEARLREAQKMAHIGYYYFDNVNLKIEWSEELYRIFGKDKNFNTTMENIRESIFKDDLQDFLSSYKSAIDKKARFKCEYRIKLNNGEIRHVAENARIIYDNIGSPRRTIGTIQDISDLKRAELEIRKLNENLEQRILVRTKEYQESEEKFRTFLKYIPDGFLLIDQDCKIILSNRQAEKIFGYQSTELTNTPLKMLIPEKCGQEYINDADNFFMTRQNNVVDSGKVCQAIRSNGEEFPADIRIGPVNIKNVTYIICIVRDITEKKLAEDELKRAKIDAEAANRTKSEFLANMSHEIRTPLNAVLGITDLLFLQITDDIQRNYLDTIKSSSKTLLTLIDDILDLSKIEAGKLKLNYNYVKIKSVIDEVENIFSLRAKEKGLQIVTEIDAMLPLSVYIDEIRIRQVLLNLVSNAVKFTSKGYVKILAKRIEKSNTKRGIKNKANTIDILISVEDSGIGIQKPFLQSIFEAFTQQEDLDTKKYGGTGLGLAISNRLIKLMNGNISVKSELNKGSVFTIILKEVKYSYQKTSETKKKKDISISKHIFHPSKIVIADDNIANRKFLRGIFARSEIEVFEATNGVEAFDMVLKLKPDVLISDIKMPLLDGFELSEKIKTHPELKHIPIIANSAAVMSFTRDMLDEAFFDEFLPKPIDNNKLLETLKKYLPYKSTGSEEIPKATKSLPVKINPEIVKELKELTLTQWKKISQKQKINDVREFKDLIGKVGEKYSIEALQEYNKDLNRAVESFDIDSIIRLINNYPKLLDSFESAKD
jgi:PAS domain S-box-containing protein